MKKGFLLVAVLFILVVMANAGTKMDEQFNTYKEGFVLDLWKMYPGWASSVGYHLYDSALVVPTNAARTEEVNFCKNELNNRLSPYRKSVVIRHLGREGIESI